ncbi:hypothetical protein NBRC10512_004561 [Rhodotorula toruloides]|uniref:RHTO0S10e03796g1_1 n=2 Tax=Rhodotorula toruloides TaxID=5286 RepID=A0A061B573_RHOTO|nr:actin cortical patch SUR7/pH-response regulator PalI family protein [Rhodotorula toruloides NP11]EMS18985.1 actin cortical patch SUR7/pH-response regulator PalI family protein [Rhodotorula toruloides NP11]KAJ8293127.1 hypothetical protein OF846_003829 [Rhodotorula toruloides]CDR44974.1 RHTO0S10e03796g1_1 [Rhodotorula toruloides]
MLRLNTSPRVPSFWGPMLLAAALLLVSNFSEPYWQNFYIVQGKALNTTIKLGAWGACTSYRNATGINGPSTFCTSHYSGYDYYYVPNNTANGINQFPTVADDNTILGLNAASTDRIFVLGSGATSTYWVHVIATILTCLCVASLILSPKHLGSENSRLFALQKSGIVTIILALISFVVTLVAFCIEIAVALPAKNRLNNAADGITASLGNVQWFTLPCAIVMIPALLSVLLRATTQHEYVDL